MSLVLVLGFLALSLVPSLWPYFGFGIGIEHGVLE